MAFTVSKRLILLPVTAVIFLSLASVSYAAKKTIAVVGPKKISLSEFNKRYDDIRRKTVNPPTKRAFLEDLVRYEVGLQEADRLGLRKDPRVIERMNQELYKGLLETQLGKKVARVKVTTKEMKAYYRKYPEVRTSHILVEIKPGANKKERKIARARADEIYRDVKKSKRPFEELVKLYSDDVATKKLGGDIGFQTRLSVFPTYYDAAVRLRPGKISKVVETPYGFHIIKLTKKNRFKDANKMQLRAAIFERKKVRIFNDYFKKVKRKYKISVRKNLIK